MSRNQRVQRSARKLNRKEALALHAKGLSTGEIAQHQQVAPSTVWRFLNATKPERQAVEQFKRQRADVFARLQGMSLDLQERILATMDDRFISALAAHQKGPLLQSLTVQAGILFDKERLERGESTQNVALLSKLIDSAHDTLFKRTPVPSTVAQKRGPEEGDSGPA